MRTKATIVETKRMKIGSSELQQPKTAIPTWLGLVSVNDLYAKFIILIHGVGAYASRKKEFNIG